MDIGAWLRGLDLGQYERAFRDNDVDADLLAGLTAEDLKEIGVASLGHRKRLLAAIAALAGPAGPQPSPAMPPVPPPTQAASRAERRQLTVMFVDLVGSTALSADLDPEEMRDVLRAYQDAVTGEVARYEGHVAKLMGDGVLCYFGWPRAHEDDAERAVRAGLAVTTAVDRLASPRGEALAARVGIATGLVVVGDVVGEGAAREEAVAGETPNLAARLQALAEPGTVVIAGATRALLGGTFDLDDLGPQSLKGLPNPVRAFRVAREAPAGSRFEARHAARTLVPLVGRERELALLLDRWELARGGEGQAVLLSGEPGIGKSRLVQALRERAAAAAAGDHTRLLYQCSPYHAASALHPVIEQLGRAAGFAREDTPAARLDKLEALLAVAGTEAGGAAALLAALLELPTEGRYPPLELTPQRRKQLTFQVLLGQLRGLAAKRPVLAVLEDAHWIDPTTQELFDLVVEHLRDLPVLLVATCRPEHRSPWGGQGHVVALSLSRIGRGQAKALAGGLAGGRDLPEAVVERIVARADGVPLFVEELTKAVIESGLLDRSAAGGAPTASLAALAIPSTLHDSLLARLDRLAPVKEVAQAASVIGREFDRELLAAVAGLPKAGLTEALARLIEAELVFPRGESGYAFKHALVRDAAYQSLLKARRQALHARVADALEERFHEVVVATPEILAHHYAEAGLGERAVAYWLAAGRSAAARSATAEAAAHFSQALRCLSTLPATTENRRRELEAQVALAPALIHVKGYAAPDTGRAWARALALCRELDARDQMASVLGGQYVYHFVRSEFGPSREAAQELVRFDSAGNDAAAQFVGRRALGFVLFSTGDLVGARREMEEAIAGLDRLEQQSQALAFGTHPQATCLSWLAHTLFILGHPDQAAVRRDEALRRGLDCKSLNTRAYTLCHAAKLSALVGDRRSCAGFAATAIALATEQGFPQWLAEARIAHGFAVAEAEGPAAGLAELDRGLEAYQATGAVHWRNVYLGWRSRLLADLGRHDEARHALAEALADVRRTDERWFEAELERLAGEALAREARIEEAEASFSRALSVARHQGANTWELRAATSLARLRAAR